MARYPRAQWIPSTHFGYPQGATGQNKPRFIIIHGTGWQADQSAVGVAQDFSGFGPYPGSGSNPNSVHFAVDRKGAVTQIVDTSDAAWGNGVISPGHDPWWVGQPNLYTVSIEHTNDGNNSLAPTPEQLASSFALVLWLCQTLGIPARRADASGGITGHFSIDPANRSRCPGPNYPFEDLFAFLEGASKVQVMAPGAVAISEFARDHLGNYKHATCVETAALECAIAQHPAFRNSVGNVGDYLSAMVSLWQGYGTGVSSQGASSYVDATRWLRGLGYKVDEDVFSPADWWEVLVAGLEEGSVWLVGVNNAQGLHGDEPGVHNHGLAALGIDGNGNIVCGDPDNQASQVHMPGSPYGAFVTYSKADLAAGGICSLTRVYPMSGVPAGWSDDGTYLYPPKLADGSQPKDPKTGEVLRVKQGFRDHVMTKPWDPQNIPLENEVPLPSLEQSNPDIGAGSRQTFRWVRLEWTPKRNVFESWLGVELLFVEQHQAPAPAPAPALPADLGPKLAGVLTVLATASADVAAVQKELGL